MNAIIYVGLPNDMKKAVRQKNTMLKDIIEKEFDVPPGTLFTRSRKKEICNGRQLYCSIIYHTTMLSLAHAGRMAGGYDHATVLHSRRNISRWLVQEKQFRESAIRVVSSFMGHKYPYMDEQFIKQQTAITMERMIKNESHSQRIGKFEKKTFSVMINTDPLRIPIMAEVV